MPDDTMPPQNNQPAFHAMPEKYYLGKQPKAKSKRLLVTVIVLVVIALGLGVAYFFTRGMNNGRTTNITANSLSPVNQATLNRNANRNINALAPANANLNTNTLTFLNTNSTQLNTQPTNTAGPVINTVTNSLFSTNTNTATITNVARLADSVDTDHDGLTDVEELLYGTNKNLADTDGDGYSDGVEVAGGYNPRSAGLIISTNLVKEYVHPMFGYKILFPSTWIQNPNPQTSNGVIFSTSTGEFVGIDVENNTAKLSARDWYLKASPGIDLRSVTTIQNTAKTLEGVLSLDGQTAYYTAGERAYIISYNTNLLSTINFRTTFEMMYKSFSLTPVVLTNTNSGANTNAGTANTNSSLNSNANTNSSTPTNVSTNTGY